MNHITTAATPACLTRGQMEGAVSKLNTCIVAQQLCHDAQDALSDMLDTDIDPALIERLANQDSLLTREQMELEIRQMVATKRAVLHP